MQKRRKHSDAAARSDPLLKHSAALVTVHHSTNKSKFWFHSELITPNIYCSDVGAWTAEMIESGSLRGKVFYHTARPLLFLLSG